MHNIRSYNKNNDKFAAMLSSICKIPEIIVLTETWLSPFDNDRRLLDGYTEFNTVRSVGRCGESVLCCDSLTVSYIPELSRCNDSIESSIIDIILRR